MTSRLEDHTKVADDLLRGTSDWTGVPEIVRLTVRALVETVKTQGSALRDLERSLSGKVTRAELQAAMASKADYIEISEQISELRSYLENRSILSEIQFELTEKVSHEELANVLSQKASIDDLETLGQSCTSTKEFEASVQDFYSRMEKLQKDFNSQLRDTAKELETVGSLVSRKGDYENIQSIEEKLMSSLNNKANKSELEAALMSKADIQEVQKLNASLASKAESETVGQLSSTVDEKLDYSEFNEKYLPLLLQKAEQGEIDNLQTNIREIRSDYKKVIDEMRRDMSVANSNGKREVESLKDQILLQLSTKADIQETDKILNLAQKKIDHVVVEELINAQGQEFRETIRVMDEKVEGLVNAQEEKVQVALQDVHTSLKKAHDAGSEIQSSIKDIRIQHAKSTEEFKEAAVSSNSQLLEEIQSLQQRLEELSSANSSEFAQVHEQIHESVQDALEECKTAIQSSSAQAQSSLETLEKTLQDFFEAEVFNIKQALENKADKEQVSQLVFSGHQAEILVNIKQNIERIFVELEMRARKEEFDRHVQHTRLALEDVSKDMLLKANIKDLCGVLDSKASVEDVNQALTEIHKELDVKASQSEMTEHLNEQALINEGLCTENTVGRWIWKSRELKNGCVVVWDVQAVNTCPDNFVWDQDASAIIVVTPGLYEIVFGFYSRKKPKVQLLINDDPVLSAVNNASYVIHHSSGRLMNVTSHPSGNIAGLTLIDFLSLPPRAKVSLAYTGETKTEGFLGLKKL